MTDLVIHIGLPKTATTTLQEHVFPLSPYYLGKRLRWSPATRFAADLSHLCAAMSDHSSGHTREQVEAWVARVLREAERRPAPESATAAPIVISDEGLSRWLSPGGPYTPINQTEGSEASYRGAALQRSGRIPISRLLEDHLVPVWTQHGAVSVIMTLRDRADLLASLYAQQSHLMPFACQEDFERQVRSVAATRDPYVRFAASVAALQQAVGDHGDVLALDLATLRAPHSVAALAGLTGIPSEQLLVALGHHRNRRSSAGEEGSWELRGSSPALGWALRFAKALRSTRPGKRLLESESQLAFEVRRAFNRLIVDGVVGIRGRADGRTQASPLARRIVVTDELRSAVSAAFADDDRQLARLLEDG
jgi:hypothetical protein